MASPRNKIEFREYVKRRLGHPIIRIDVTDEQMDDRIDDAISYWNDYHYDGNEKVFYAHRITAADIASRDISLPEDILTVTRVFPFGGLFGSRSRDGLFDVQYQFAQSDIFRSGFTFNMSSWVFTKHYFSTLEFIFRTAPIVYFNRYKNKLAPGLTWNKISEGDYLMIECVKKINLDDYPEAYSDMWLSNLAQAMIKKQWGQNLKKFSGVALPGSVTLDGQKLYDEGDRELEDIKNQMITQVSIPQAGWVG